MKHKKYSIEEALALIRQEKINKENIANHHPSLERKVLVNGRVVTVNDLQESYNKQKDRLNSSC